MRAGVMSAGVFGIRGVTRRAVRDEVLSKEGSVRPPAYWNPEQFADEQIRSLMRQVFFSSVTPPARQVVFSAVERGTDVRALCTRVGEALAAETNGDVAVVADYSPISSSETYRSESTEYAEENRITPLREAGKRVRDSLWLVPLREKGTHGASTASLHGYLGQIRREFEYSIVAGAQGRESTDAITMAQFADGLILVLSAQYTRRVAARRVIDDLESARVRLLGTVLRDREFPIPERIYRRL